MAISLKDQLLKSGLIDKKKAGQLSHEQRQEAARKKKEKKGKASQAESIDAQTKLNEAARLKKEKDKALNEAREQARKEKAIAAEVKQIIDQNKITLDPSNEIAFNFVDGSKIKRIYVSDKQQAELARAQLGIVLFESKYYLIPTLAAEQIEKRLPGTVILMKPETPAEDDPYADYQIPDDLMW